MILALVKVGVLFVVFVVLVLLWLEAEPDDPPEWVERWKDE